MGKRRSKFEAKARQRATKKFQRDKKGTPQINGSLSVSSAGYGFVAPDGENPGPDIFIPPKYLGQAMDGDQVAVKLLDSEGQTPGRGPAGRIVEILSHGRESFVGELLANHLVRPLSKRIPDDVKVIGGTHGAKKGDWVEVKLFRGENRRGPGISGEVSDSFGHAGEIESDLRLDF